MNNIVLNIPHSSTGRIFDLGKWPHNPHFINDVVRHVTDWYTDFLFYSHNPAVQEVVFPYSRLVCDVTGTDEESIILTKQRGYERGELTDSERTKLHALCHKHNEKLNSLITEESVLIECHSFADAEVNCDIMVGTTDWERNHRMVDMAMLEFKNSGYTVSILDCEKFAFTTSCKSMLIKVNRRIYMDQNLLLLDRNSRQWMRWFGCLNRIYNSLLTN